MSFQAEKKKSISTSVELVSFLKDQQSLTPVRAWQSISEVSGWEREHIFPVALYSIRLNVFDAKMAEKIGSVILSDSCKTALLGFSVSQLTTLLRAFANTQYRCTQVLQAIGDELTAKEKQEYTPTDLASCIASFGRLKVFHEAFFSAVSEEKHELLDRMTSKQLISVLHSCNRLHSLVNTNFHNSVLQRVINTHAGQTVLVALHKLDMSMSSQRFVIEKPFYFDMDDRLDLIEAMAVITYEGMEQNIKSVNISFASELDQINRLLTAMWKTGLDPNENKTFFQDLRDKVSELVKLASLSELKEFSAVAKKYPDLVDFVAKVKAELHRREFYMSSTYKLSVNKMT